MAKNPEHEQTGGSQRSRRTVEPSHPPAQRPKPASDDHEFREIFESASVGLLQIDPQNGRILRGNDAFCRIIGYGTDELHAFRFPELMHPDNRAGDWQTFLLAAQGQESDGPHETRCIHRNGSEIWIRLRATFLRDDAGRATRAVVVCEDVTEPRQAELTRHRSDECFRTTFENAAAGIAHVGLDGRFLRVNNRLCEITGFSREELMALRVGDITNPVDCAADAVQAHRLHQGQIDRYSIEKRYTRKDGTTIWANLSCSIQHDQKGEPKYYIGIIQDISQRKAADQALRESVGRTQAMLDNLPVGIWFTDEQGAILYGNEAAHRIWAGARYVGPEQYGQYKAWWWETGEPIQPEDWAVVQALREGEVSVNQILEIECFDGMHKIMRNVAVPVRGDDNEVLGTVVLNEDITERMRAEEALRESEDRLRGFFEASAVYMSLMELEPDDIIHVLPNQKMAEFFDRPPEQVAGMRCRELGLPEELISYWLQLLRDCGRSGLPTSLDYPMPYRGRQRWFHGTTTPIPPGESGRPRFALVAADITERRQLEEQLRQLNGRLEEEVRAQTEELRQSVDRLQREVAQRIAAEEKLRKRSQMLEAFFQHSLTPLAFLDRQFNFVRVNRAYARVQQADPEDFTNRNYFDVHANEKTRAIFEQIVQTGQPYRASARPAQDREDPQRVTYWDWRITPLLDDRGAVQLLVFNLQDVTQEQAVRAELEQRAHQLQQLTLELSQAEERERKRLAELLHDDLQQQLAAAKFHLGLLTGRSRGDNETQEIAEQLEELLRDAIAKSRSLSHELSPTVLYQSDLGEIFEWLSRQFEAKHGLTVQVEVRGLAQSQSDPLKAFLFRAAQEILFNAIKHAKVTDVALRIQRRRGYVWLTISDNGRGFDVTQLDESGGFGLLSIRERVELLGGRMRIRSGVGRGSTFLIKMPDKEAIELIEAVQDKTPRDNGLERRSAGKRKEKKQTVKGLFRVLLIDDHKVMRDGLAALLAEEQDIEIVGQASNGAEGVDLARQLQPDVIVLDVAMPVMTGDEATRRIRAERPHVRIIALSMFEEPGVAQMMHDAGADVWLTKSGPTADLLAAIRSR